MSCPALCVANIETIKTAPRFFYYIDSEKLIFTKPLIQGTLHVKWCCEQERFDNIATWALNIINTHDVEKVFMEGYSMGSRGRVFNIAENAGLLKHFLWRQNIPFDSIAPTSVKKNFHGKGNADKSMMVAEFERRFPKHFDFFKKQNGSPVTDMVDAYAVLETGLKSIV